MKKLILSILIIIFVFTAVSAQQTTSFSYQGKLNSGLVAANGSYDFRFEVYDALENGNLIGTLNLNAVQVTNGIFTVSLDFGANAFNGGDRFLDISVKLPSDSSYTRLMPRQKIASVPYSTKAITSETAATAQNSNNLGGIAANNYLQKNGDASQLTNINGANIINNSVSIAQLSPDALPNNYSLKLLASRRWDLLKYQQDFTVGSSPGSIEFDGTNIWVACGGNNTIYKIRPSDGTILATVNLSFQVNQIAFDGANIWVTNSGPNTITRIRASDGAVLGTFSPGVGNAPQPIAFDGRNMWVATVIDNLFIKMDKNNPGILQSAPTGGNFPTAMAFDGNFMWITNNNSGNVSKIRAKDGVLFGLIPVTVSGAGARGIAFDGTNMWIASAGNKLTKIRAFDGVNLGIFTIPSATFTEAVGFDGVYIWVSDSAGDTLTKIKPSDGSIVGTYTVGTNARSIAFDGANIWTANTGSSNVTRFLPTFPEP